MLQFIFTALGASVVVSIASLLWPKFTGTPRPAPLQQVRDIVVKTQVGGKAAEMFGVSDESQIAPIDIPTLAGSLVQQAGSAATQKVSQEITNRAVTQIVSQVDKLPDSEREMLKQAICHESSPSATR